MSLFLSSLPTTRAVGSFAARLTRPAAVSGVSSPHQQPHPHQQQQQHPHQQQQRWISFPTLPVFSNKCGLDEFRDSVTRDQRMKEPVGRQWSAKELRRKSFDDLHKLWYVLYKEKNMLMTEANLSRRRGIIFPQSQRRQKVKKSMGAIKFVLGERKRDRLAQVALEGMNRPGEGNDSDDDNDDDDDDDDDDNK